jgi:hypothetical protein
VLLYDPTGSWPTAQQTRGQERRVPENQNTYGQRHHPDDHRPPPVPVPSSSTVPARRSRHVRHPTGQRARGPVGSRRSSGIAASSANDHPSSTCRHRCVLREVHVIVQYPESNIVELSDTRSTFDPRTPKACLQAAAGERSAELSAVGGVLPSVCCDEQGIGGRAR